MTFDYKLALKTTLDLQDLMNKTVDPDWIAKHRNWELASLVEVGEAVAHLGYKWWKKEDSDWDQAFIELVDILHFVSSRMIEQIAKETPEEVLFEDVLAEVQRFHDNADWLAANTKNKDEVFKFLMSLSNSLTEAYGTRRTDHQVYLLCCLSVLMGKSAEELFTVYLAKNTLNIFRQKNGYKEGTYVKIWNGQEDNEVMWDLLKKDPELSTSFSGLYSALKAQYPG